MKERRETSGAIGHDALNAWFGVSAKDLNHRGSKSWWCVPRSAVPGDMLVMYQKLVGVVRLERLQSVPTFRESRCSESGLLTVNTQLIATLKQPITAKELKVNRALRNLPAVRRNFQGTCFRIPSEEWVLLRELINSRR